MRKLATIQKIEDVKPIPGADNIVCVQIMGWECVSKKGDFNPGDLCVYFEVDSFLPIRPEFDFLAKSCHRFYNKTEGYRIKTIKLRGQLSQGLALPLSCLPEIATGTFNIDDDVTDLLKVIKYDVEEAESNPNSFVMGVAKTNFPRFISKTDETRIQSSVANLKKLAKKPYYISTKMDGSSSTYFYNTKPVKDTWWNKLLIKFGLIKKQFGVCSRNIEVKDSEHNVFWKVAKKYHIEDKLRSLNKNIAIQGEVCGPGIQKNKLKLDNHKLYIFNVFDIDSKEYYSLNEMLDFCFSLGFTTVPIEEVGESFEYTDVKELLERAKGKYPKGGNKEGIVIRSQERASAANRISFKVINNDFLLKDED